MWPIDGKTPEPIARAFYNQLHAQVSALEGVLDDKMIPFGGAIADIVIRYVFEADLCPLPSNGASRTWDDASPTPLVVDFDRKATVEVASSSVAVKDNPQNGKPAKGKPRKR